MFRLQSYLNDAWHPGDGPTRPLVDPATEEVIAETSTGGLDHAAALAHARTVGGPALRALSFAERGGLLKAMSRALHGHREELLELAQRNNGATRGDAKFDVDGATGTLSYYAWIGKNLGDARFLVDGEADKLGQGARFVGQHVRLPRPGVAVHINAFNFPAWGTFEKVACSFLAGMPVVTKPATATALLTWRMIQILVDECELPAGSLSFVAGPPGDMLDHLGPQDVLAFTGSADTGAALRGGKAVLHDSVRVNVEADSLNAAVLAADVGVGDDVWNTFVRNVVKDMTQKTGQKCTAVRRILVPAERVDDVTEALVAELAAIRVGNPLTDGVDMGPVTSASQLRDVRAGIRRLADQARIATGGADPIQGKGAPDGKGFYVAPTLLVAGDARAATQVHSHEVFGPSATVLPYDGSAAEAAAIVALGKGSLVSTVYTDDRDWLADAILEMGPWNGRLQAVTGKVADQSTPPGMVLPNCTHGGPGRAGGGEELGGARGLEFYTNRVAVQGDRGLLKKILGEA
ncbi:MAG: 3,4-dehydroadipyl-CoA semialdehyde dehydrogenase [Alphaproteobacteria bacterium]|nr:3,4-dehydroadipyl-CoA semialdehyde dehydrogenase [Alphaproteobacteria bacterium]